jgi:ABC-type sugar transport system substrate-binding protein
MKKWLLIAALLVSLVLFVSACSTGQDAGEAPDVDADNGAGEEEMLELTFVTPLVAHPVWDVARQGFEDAAKDFNFKANYVGPQGIDPAEMVNQLEIALASQVDGIITMPIAPEAMRPAFKKLEEAGMPVIFVGAEDDESTALAFIGTNEAELGKQGAEGLMAKMDGEPIYAYIQQSTMDASFANKARDGYIAALEDYPGGFTLVLNEPNNSDMMIAMEKLQNAFNTYPEINVVIGVAGEVGPAAAKVVKEMGIQDRITIIAIDDVAETMDFVKEGVIYGTMAQNFYKMGYLGAQFLCEYIREGKEPASFKNDSGSIFVTMENFDTYQEMLKR